jgi:D-serine deaminase-like pyridoxal phosphate-dependent protein
MSLRGESRSGRAAAAAEPREAVGRVTSLHDLETPALLVDAGRLEENLAEMARVARDTGTALRPHWKTHKCARIARRQIELGAVGGTVAKPGEAAVFLEAGFDDLLIATPVVDPRKIDRLLAALGGARLAVLVESEEGRRLWEEGAARAGRTVPVLLEIDVGMSRTGVGPGEDALPLAKAIDRSPHLELRGVMTHAGHAYAARSAKEIAEIGRIEGETLASTARMLRAAGLACPVVSVGSTPTVRHSARIEGVTEIRPGNYVFHDAIQVGLGVVPEERCALTVLATVIARPTASRIVVDAGAKCLSSDRGTGPAALRGFGRLLGEPETILHRLSEEHGILEVAPGDPRRVGDRVRILPNHACVTVNLHETLHVVRGETVEATWRVGARGRVA